MKARHILLDSLTPILWACNLNSTSEILNCDLTRQSNGNNEDSHEASVSECPGSRETAVAVVVLCPVHG